MTNLSSIYKCLSAGGTPLRFMENLDVTACTLVQFLKKASDLYQISRNNEEDIGDYVAATEFVLRGFHMTQHSISALSNRFVPAQNNPTILRDYDSLIGFSDELRFNREIFLFSVFNPSLPLKESVHLKTSFRLNSNEVCRS